MVASHDGRAVYLDNTNVGNLSKEAQEAWRQSLSRDRLAAGLYQQRNLVLLNGSDPRFEWIEDPQVPVAGTVPFDERPFIERDDYIFNSNNSYWLSSPRQPLSGYSILYGPVETARSLRTRMNMRLLENRYGDAGEDGKFNRREIQEALFDNRSLAAELLLPELVETCNAAQDESLAPACDALAGYAGHLDLESPGAVLFREWLTRYDDADYFRAGELFREGFDAERPEVTPAGLADRERALKELRGAIAVLKAAELPLDVGLDEAQFAWRNGEAIPVHGGLRPEGIANLQMSGDPSDSPISGVSPSPIADSRYLTDAGYPVVHGSSFILTLGFEDEGPVAEALLSYSQSGDPGSPHFRDQTDLYAAEKWRPIAFTADQVDADTKVTQERRNVAM